MGFTYWLAKRWIDGDGITPILASIYLSSGAWGALAAWVIGSVCRFWPFPWAGLTFLTVMSIYIFGGFVTWMNISDYHHKLSWIYGITLLVGSMFLIGLSISWWPDL